MKEKDTKQDRHEQRNSKGRRERKGERRWKNERVKDTGK